MLVSVSGVSSGSSSRRGKIGPALLDERVQPAELIEGLAVDRFALGARDRSLAVVVGKQLGVVVQRGLGAGQIRVAELLGLLLDLVGRLGVHVADAEPHQVVRQLFQQVDAVELGLDLLGQAPSC